MRPESRTFLGAKARLAVRLRELRLERRLSQEQLADLAGCDRTYIGMLERRLGNPSLSVLCAVAEALGVEVNGLLMNGP